MIIRNSLDIIYQNQHTSHSKVAVFILTEVKTGILSQQCL